jgi:hypothetical protein
MVTAGVAVVSAHGGRIPPKPSAVYLKLDAPDLRDARTLLDEIGQ